MSSEDFERGRRAGFEDARRQFVMFHGVRSPYGDHRMPEFNTDVPPWAALLDYRASLAQMLAVARTRAADAERRRDEASERQLDAAQRADEHAAQRRAAGGAQRLIAPVLRWTDRDIAREKAQIAQHHAQWELQQDFANRLADELARVDQAVASLVATVQKHLAGGDRPAA